MRAAPVGVVAGTVALALAASGATPQQAARAPRAVTEVVRVNVVNVEVWATGRDGRPVLDLRPEEFELREDGVVVPLTNFLAPAPPAGAPAAAQTAAPPAASAVPAPSPEEQQRTLVVFVDDLNLVPTSRIPVLEKLPGFLEERIREGFHVVVLEFNDSLAQLTPLTTDPKIVSAAVAKLRRTATSGTMMYAARAKVLRDVGREDLATNSASASQGRSQSGTLDAAVRQATGSAVLSQVQSYAEELRMKQGSLLGALGKVVDALAGVPGRKTVLFVSDGPPANPGADLYAEVETRFAQGSGDYFGPPLGAVRTVVRRVAERANASRITFYTVNGGVTSGRDVSAEIAASSAAQVDTINLHEREASLIELTAGTGGLKLPNADALPTLVADLAASYSLGYSPNHYGDGRYHRLAVTVTRAGVSVRTREGYLDKAPEERQADATAAALFAGGNSNPLAARVEIGSPRKQGRGKVLVPLTVFVPAQSLLLLESGNMREGQVTVTIAAAKGTGRRSEIARRRFPIAVPEARVASFLKRDVSFTFELLIEAGDATISVMASDDTAHVESVVVANVAAAPARR